MKKTGLLGFMRRGLAAQEAVDQAANEARRERNCPFYGFALATGDAAPPARFFLLVNTHSDQCGAVRGSWRPCEEELAGFPVDWKQCRLLRELGVDNHPRPAA